MTIDIPVFVEERGAGAGGRAGFVVRPLFFGEPVQRAEKLSRALSRLASELQGVLRKLAEEPRHDALGQWTFRPELEHRTLELRIELEGGAQPHRYFVVGYRCGDRQLWFLPSMPQSPFEVGPGQDLEERAKAALTRLLLEEERKGLLDLSDHTLNGKGRIVLLPVTFDLAALARRRSRSTRAHLFGTGEKMNGERELRRVGRCLNGQYPDELQRAVGLDRECAELARLLADKDRRPIVIVGPRKVGKTTLVHELVWRIAAGKQEKFAGGREVWLVSPMRLISGMSVLGEWESRVTAILEDSARRDRVLYIDDLPGLFAAGVSSASDLNVGQVLKPVLQRRSVRVLAEVTPESWRVLRERDRAFAELFHVVPLSEPVESETLRVLIDVTRRLEDEHGCRFALDAVPAAYELHRRHVSDAAFPGKAAGFLQRIAIRNRGSEIGRGRILDEFAASSGIGRQLLDDGIGLTRADVLAGLRSGIVGQDEAIEAFVDVSMMLKARLNDPRRPLATMLLLGPTGVGKTQAAKTLARVLYGDEKRLLRFDMNEFVDAAAAARLIGTPSDPDGLLTGAIRRQPFSVVLLDEYEKAAQEVSDLLLAVLDEGRLTDALGRVADFTQSVILLTSNLGATEARSTLGFRGGSTGTDASAVYLRAAERHFRPEFFNRLDRVIPFRTLGREELEGIVRLQLDRLLAREGLRRRQCLLHITGDAMGQLVELGHQPLLGARALKRVLEREVAQAMAASLAGRVDSRPTVAVLDSVAGRLHLEHRTLIPPEPTAPWRRRAAALDLAIGERTGRRAGLAAILDAVEDHIETVESRLESEAPSGAVPLGALPREHARYFACRERIERIRNLIDGVEERMAAKRSAPRVGATPSAKPVKVVGRTDNASRSRLARMRAATALQADLADLEPMPRPTAVSLTALLREVGMLEVVSTAPVPPETVVFSASRIGGGPGDWLEMVTVLHTFALFDAEAASLHVHRGRHGTPATRSAHVLTGPGVSRLLPPDGSLVLLRHGSGALDLIRIGLAVVGGIAEAEEAVERLAAGQKTAATGVGGDLLEEWTLSSGPDGREEIDRLTDWRTGHSWTTADPAFPDGLLDGSLRMPALVDSALESAHP